MLKKLLSPFISFEEDDSPQTFKKALDATNKALLTGNDKERSDTVSKILKFSHSSSDLSFIGYSIAPLIASPDLYTRIIGFRAISLFLSPSSPAVEMLPAAIRRSFQYQELLVPALNAVTVVLNPFVFHYLKNDLIELASESNDVPRILALHCVYTAYKQNAKNVKHLVPLLKKAIMQASLRYTASSILCEISFTDCSVLKHFPPIVLNELPLATPHMFTKLSKFLQNMLVFDESLSESIEKPLAQYLSRNKDHISTIEASFLVSKLKKSQGRTQMCVIIGQRVQEIIQSERDQNVKALSLWALSLIYPSFKIDTVLLTGIGNTDDSFMRSCAQRLKCVMDTERSSIINDALKLAARTTDAQLIDFIMGYMSKEGLTYVQLLLALGQLKSNVIRSTVAKLMREIKDGETQQLLLDEISDTQIETTDDPVGEATADCIANWSNRDTDFEMLIPASISQKDEAQQCYLIGCATTLWMRLQCKMPKVFMFRLQLLTQSFSHEVRQRAGELLDLIGSLQ